MNRSGLPVGAEIDEGGVRFRVWAPGRRRVRVRLGPSGAELDLAPESDGYFAAHVPDVSGGALPLPARRRGPLSRPRRSLPAGRSLRTLRSDRPGVRLDRSRVARRAAGEPALSVGDYAPVAVAGTAFAFERRAEGRAFLLALNPGDAPATLAPSHSDLRGHVVFAPHATSTDRAIAGRIDLAPNEGIVALLDAE